MAVLAIAIIASYFSFQSLVRHDYLLLTSPVGDEVVSGMLQISGIWLRTPIAYSVRLEANGEVIDSRTSLPAVWDSTQFPDGMYHAVLEITGRVLFFKVLAQIASVEFRIDNTPPSLVVRDLENGEVIKGTRKFSVRAEGGLVRDVIIDGLHRLPVPQDTFVEVSLDTALLGDGRHEIHIIASDPVGNGEDRIMWFVVDNTPPRILSLGPAEEIPLRGEVEVQPAIDELTLAGQTWWIDDEIVSREFPLALNTAKLSDGAHAVRLEVTDQSGLTSQYTATLCIDNTSPVIGLTINSSLQEVASRTSYVDGIKLRADDILEIYKHNPGDDISIHVIDSLAGGATSFLKMRFIARWSVANVINRFFGEFIGYLFAYRILPFFKAITTMPLAAGISVGNEISASPPIPPVWDSLGEETVIRSFRLPIVEMCDVRQGCIRGIGVRISLQRLSSLSLTEEGLEISELSSINAIEPILEFGRMQGVYDKDLLEEVIVGDYVHKTWRTRLLEGGWVKVGYRMEGRPGAGFQGSGMLSFFRVGWAVGLKAIQIHNVEITSRVSYDKTTHESLFSHILDWSSKPFFQLGLYWEMDVGFGF